MTDTLAPPRAPSGIGRGIVRAIGWLFIATGATLLLFLVWLLWFTNIETGNVQDELREKLLEGFDGFDDVVVDANLLPEGGEDGLAVEDATGEAELGSGIALMEFERPGAASSPVNDNTLVVVQGADIESLKRGPGATRGSSAPGGDGNFAVIGHRTTYGAPFYNMDLLEMGDLVHVTDRRGERFTYRVLEGSGTVSSGTRVVGASEVWVLGQRPLGGSAKLLTLVTCHPRFSSSNRLVAFAELVE